MAVAQPMPTSAAPTKSAAPAASKASVTLTDYYAEWCGPCHAMEPILKEIESEFAGKVAIEKIDVDKEQDKANAAGVMSIPTLHISKGGKIVQTMIGFQAKDDLSKALNLALENRVIN